EPRFPTRAVRWPQAPWDVAPLAEVTPQSRMFTQSILGMLGKPPANLSPSVEKVNIKGLWPLSSVWVRPSASLPPSADVQLLHRVRTSDPRLHPLSISLGFEPYPCRCCPKGKFTRLL